MKIMIDEIVGYYDDENSRTICSLCADAVWTKSDWDELRQEQVLTECDRDDYSFIFCDNCGKLI